MLCCAVHSCCHAAGIQVGRCLVHTGCFWLAGGRAAVGFLWGMIAHCGVDCAFRSHIALLLGSKASVISVHTSMMVATLSLCGYDV